ncbi:MAG: glyoxalase [Kineosporiaceae bacterium]|nr:glyoxalase [Aeromicrobium sp.]
MVTRGVLHHVELRTRNLPAALSSWGWILEQLGYEVFQTWPAGQSWKTGDTYIVLEDAPPELAHDRRGPGLNHLAFHAGTTADVDQLWADGVRYRWNRLYEDRHPNAGGEGTYAAFLENDERFKIELIAS